MRWRGAGEFWRRECDRDVTVSAADRAGAMAAAAGAHVAAVSGGVVGAAGRIPEKTRAALAIMYFRLHLVGTAGSISLAAATDHMTIMKRQFDELLYPITRRATLGFVLSAAISGLAPIWRASAQTRPLDEMQARFLQWSRTATGFADLPTDAARTCMELLLRSTRPPNWSQAGYCCG